MQLADLTVNVFPKMAGGFGHAGIGVNTDQTEGFYPRDTDLATTLKTLRDGSVPGVIKNDDLSKPYTSVHIRTSPAQDAAVRAYLSNRAAHPGLYNLYTKNCASVCENALGAAGIHVPPDMIPNQLLKDLP